MGGRITVIACLLLLSSCVPKSLPADWPIPELTLPPRAKVEGVVTPSNSALTHWYVQFTGGGTEQEMIDHVESCLQPLGYVRVIETRNNQDTGLGYFSPDYRTNVTLTTVKIRGKCGLMVSRSDINVEMVEDCKKPGKGRVEPL